MAAVEAAEVDKGSDEPKAGGASGSEGDGRPSENGRPGQKVMTAAEYSQAVNKWLQSAYQIQAMAMGFSGYMMYQASLSVQQHHQQQQQRLQQQQQQQRPPTGPSGIWSWFSTRPDWQQQQQQQTASRPVVWRQFTVPPLWKRGVAELIDLCILLVVKAFITFLAATWLDLVDMTNYEKTLFLVSMSAVVDPDLATTVDLSSDFIFIELLYKTISCMFEAIFTSKGVGRRIGGATPGKYIMGLRVCHCDEVLFVADTYEVRVTHATNPGFRRALIRTVIKNVVFPLVFPLSLLALLTTHPRTSYDIAAKTIVVEAETDDDEGLRRNQD